MEKGIIFNIKKFAIHDGPGIRTTIFFKGCPLNCKWCHNPEGIKSGIEIINNKKKTDIKKIIGFKINKTDLMNIILKDQIFYQQSNGGVTFSGGEPFNQINFLKSVLIDCKKNNIHTTVDTCGYTTINEIDKIYDYVDLFLYDIKIIDEKKHIENTGKSNKEILMNLEYLMNKGDKVNIRIPLIPGITDTKKNLISIKEIIENFENIKEICILPYNKLSDSKRKLYSKNNNFKKYLPQTNNKIEEIKSILKSEKYKIKISG